MLYTCISCSSAATIRVEVQNNYDEMDTIMDTESGHSSVFFVLFHDWWRPFPRKSAWNLTCLIVQSLRHPGSDLHLVLAVHPG